MTVDLTAMLESKRALRRDLSARPVAEKLRMLEAMRERDLAIQREAARGEDDERLSRITRGTEERGRPR